MQARVTTHVTKGGCMKQAEDERAGYHHGELPKTLMTLALAAIAEGGTEKLSLRALARQAGVSATAPYRHFESKQDLLAALATQGFEALGERTQAANDPSLSVEERMLAVAETYVQFACDNPVAYQLMFGAILGDFANSEMLQAAAARAYEDVYTLLAEVIQSKGLGVDVDELGGVVWATVHGMASLLISNVNVGEPESAPMRALATLLKNPRQGLEIALGQLVIRD